MRIEEKIKEEEFREEIIEILEDIKISQDEKDIILEKGDRISVLIPIKDSVKEKGEKD